MQMLQKKIKGISDTQEKREKLRGIIQEKMPDLNANDLEAAKMIVRGSARSMGIESE